MGGIDGIDGKLFTPEARKGVERRRRQAQFTSSSTIAAAVMLLAAVVAVIIANTGLHESFQEFWELPFQITIGSFTLALTFETFVNDFLMAIFFLVMGLEIKYEFMVGELTETRKALLPVLGAVGGVAVPIVIYLIFNHGTAAEGGWGIPTATDIAFALGVLSILGSRIPNGLRVFLSTLAIADDLIAIIVIAVFYGHSPSLFWLGMTAVVFAALLLMNRCHVYHVRYYVLVGLVLWFCVYMSGVHATIAGVLLALAIPAKSPVIPHEFRRWTGNKLDAAHESYDASQPMLAQGDYIGHVDDIARVAGSITPPLLALKKRIEPFSSFIVLPLFALANAGVRLVGVDMGQMIGSGAVLGVFLGLVLGKPIGIMTASFITVRCGLSDLPTGVTWMHMLGAAILGGVGFTMSILVTGLAFSDPAITTWAKAAILCASVVAGVAGYLVLLGASGKQGQKTDEAAEK